MSGGYAHGGGREQVEDGKRSQRLSTAGLADNAYDLAFTDVQRHAIDNAQIVTVALKVDADLIEFEQRLRHHWA
ncbi:hypothetical protein MIC97_14550 [Aquamicrobium sp. NLF2-7]|uniref:hypothetical protein n=1 Tax=Aquamicrobium sp. NLF2-7 TaxID=2918753 RepID=UPI001EFAD40A|nr:hypothetical protein [Aquamicrobium sp. NLF2-7]